MPQAIAGVAAAVIAWEFWRSLPKRSRMRSVICGGVSPRLCLLWSGVAWSTNISGMPMRSTGTRTSWSLRVSTTAAPKPPARQPSSIVTTRPIRRAIGKATIKHQNVGLQLPNAAMFGGMSHGAMLGTLSLGHILGIGAILGLASRGVV